MGNVEPLVSPQGAVRGLRKLTTNHLLAARLVERATGLPPDIRHPNRGEGWQRPAPARRAPEWPYPVGLGLQPAPHGRAPC
jgi:hypothetical protein